MRHFFKFILDVHLELQDLVSKIWVIDLLGYLRCFLVHTSLEEALSVVEFVLDDIWVELGELVVHVGGAAVVLDVEVAVREQGKSRSVSWRELELIRQDSNYLHVLLVSDERINGLRVLTVGHSPELLMHVHRF